MAINKIISETNLDMLQMLMFLPYVTMGSEFPLTAELSTVTLMYFPYQVIQTSFLIRCFQVWI